MRLSKGRTILHSSFRPLTPTRLARWMSGKNKQSTRNLLHLPCLQTCPSLLAACFKRRTIWFRSISTVSVMRSASKYERACNPFVLFRTSHAYMQKYAPVAFYARTWTSRLDTRFSGYSVRISLAMAHRSESSCVANAPNLPCARIHNVLGNPVGWRIIFNKQFCTSRMLLEL